MAVSYAIQTDPARQQFSGIGLLPGSVVEITLSSVNPDYTNGVGVTITPAQAGLAVLYHGIGYVVSSADVGKGIIPIVTKSGANLVVKLFATGAGNQQALAEIATGGGGLANGDKIVLIIIGQ